MVRPEEMKKHIRTLAKDELISLFVTMLKDKGPEREATIPVSIFNTRLSSLESIIKYMREDLGYSNNKVALLLKKSPQSTWITYRNAKVKHPGPLKAKESPYDLPIEALASSLSTLETIVKHLKESHGLDNEHIGMLLKRDKKTIATIASRIRRKDGRL